MTRRRLALALAAAVALALLFRCARRELALDRCMDAGGCWDRDTGSCTWEQARCG